MTDRRTHDWAGLRKSLTGELLLRDEPGYDAVRRPAIENFAEVRPLAVLRCATADDAATAAAWTSGEGLPVAVRSGGHCFAGTSTTEGLVIDVTPLNAVDVHGARVRIGAGARLGPVYDQLAEHGLTLPAGCGPTVGISGLTLGGGLGILGRMYGVLSDRLVGAEIALADGRVVTCDESHEPDLFWLLRGGGGPGVVTMLEFEAVPGRDGTGFHLRWPASAAAAVILAWQEWAPGTVDEMAASLLVSLGGERGRSPVVSLFGAFTGSSAACRAAIDDLLAVVDVAPEAAIYQHGGHREIKRFLNQLEVHGPGAPEPAGFMYCASEFFARPISADAVQELVTGLGIGRAPGELRELDFMPWGGAYTRVRPDATAFAHRNGRFLLKHGLIGPPTGQHGGRAWLRRSWTLVHPWGTGGCYQNFPDPGLGDAADGHYYGGNAARVHQIRKRFDPNGTFSRAVV